MTTFNNRRFNRNFEHRSFEQCNFAANDLTLNSDDRNEEITELEEHDTDSLATTLAAVVSGGVTGAAIGRLVAGRTGSAIGAVVGGVAGVAWGNEAGSAVSHAAEGIAETVKEAPERIKAIASERFAGHTDESFQDHDDSLYLTEYAEAAPVEVEFERVQPEQIESDYIQAIDSDKPNKSNKVVAPDRATLLDPTTQELTVQNSRFRYILPAKTHYHMGVTLGRQGNLDEALDEFQQVLDLAPESAETYYNLGVALKKIGKRDQALAAMRQAGALCIKQKKTRGAKLVDLAIRRMDAYTQIQR